jgi:hypothetical protein
MQHEIELDPAFVDVPVARRVVAHFADRAGRKLGAIGADGWQFGRGAIGKEEGFDMVGMA